MVKTIVSAAFAALLVAGPVQAQDSVRDIVGGVARQYLQQEQDRAAYAQAQGANTLSAYQSYLRQFPNGMYAAQARDRVQRLGGAVVTPDQNRGDTASLSAQQRVNVQRKLNALGYGTNGTDGNFGPGTRRAIALWQRDRNYAQTGTLTAAQANEILRGTTGTASSSASASAASGPAQAEAVLSLSRQQRSAVQAGLTRRGFDTRGVDGIFGKGTRNAIAAWQRANDLTATGYLTGPQVERLTAR
ncbi:peptidoglycan-binding domain-containing protein [Paracoccus luteus]|uniref:peptidoglycan-binding domain-containing protein n=1 Tax=Paracoccus luteus TaxID=2508543 RepID=UPI00106F4568|nr:peptidoglycan-binding protein [Paracoccus luteus]